MTLTDAPTPTAEPDEAVALAALALVNQGFLYNYVQIATKIGADPAVTYASLCAVWENGDVNRSDFGPWATWTAPEQVSDGAAAYLRAAATMAASAEAMRATAAALDLTDPASALEQRRLAERVDRGAARLRADAARAR